MVFRPLTSCVVFCRTCRCVVTRIFTVSALGVPVPAPAAERGAGWAENSVNRQVFAEARRRGLDRRLWEDAQARGVEYHEPGVAVLRELMPDFVPSPDLAAVLALEGGYVSAE